MTDESDPVEVVRVALHAAALKVWRVSDYGMGRGTALWVHTGAMVMLPVEGDIWVQGAEAEGATAILIAAGFTVVAAPD